MSRSHRKVRLELQAPQCCGRIADARSDLFIPSPGQPLRVSRLDYEAYTPLALKTLRAIIQRARSTPTSSWPPPRLQPQRSADLHADSGASASTSSLPSAEGINSSPSAAQNSSSSSSSTTTDEKPPPPDSIVRIALIHRLGPVPTGESSILIAVSSPHRRRAFEVAEWLLEETKRIVPIWKREVRMDEEEKEVVEEEEEKGAGGKESKGTRGWVGLDLTTSSEKASS